MRLHSLDLSAFLAYGGAVHVDFEHLAESGFFLIHGETGSGKTSLLDAIAFAIYGRLPGAREGVRTIRSDHADASTPTQVVLDASVGGTRLRITRSPKYERPKRRGEGVTSEAARVAVERWVDGGWQPWTSNADEAGSALRQWIGLDADQFFRLVLIPQGAFANFLQASSKDRSRVLAELFRDDLRVYSRVQDWCKEQLAGAERARVETAGELARERARIAQVLRSQMVADDDVVDADWLDARIAELREESAQARLAQADALARLDSATKAHTDAETALLASERWRTARDAADKARADLDALRDAHDELRALPVEELDRHLEDAEHEARKRVEVATAANAARRALWDARAEVDAIEAEVRAGEGEQAARIKQRRELDLELERLNRTLTDGQAAALALVDVAASATALTGLVASAERRDAAAVEVEKARASVESADVAVALAERALDEARAAVSASHAALLAALLEPGAPCPVCGSVEHPHPHATIVDGNATRVADEAVEAAERTARHAADARTRALAALAAAEALLAEHARALGERGDADVEQLRTEQAEAAASESTLRALTQAAETAAEQARELQGQRAVLEESIREGDDRRSALAERLSNARAEVARAEGSAGLPQEAADEPIDTEALEAQVERVSELRAALRRCVGMWQDAVAALGALGTDASDDLPNLVETAAARDAAETARKQLDARVHDLTGTVTALAERREAFGAALRSAADADAAQRRIAMLAEPVNGRGPGRTLLTDYYLAARLRQVLDRANDRLLRMSDNRFTFVFDADAKGSGYQSLAIAVEDAWSGSARPVSSLSGGETFTASLALALGLADIVEAEAGGRALDSLFIDEGFGTLSGDYLHRVMQDLERLRAGGRLVGIISHVPELRQRIPMQLRVSRGTAGSSVTLVDAEAEGAA